MDIGFHKADLLLPKTGLEAWSVVACDQYTSDPAYWDRVDAAAQGRPSTCRIIFPEARLGKVDFESRVKEINAVMAAYLSEDVFEEHKDCLFYVERTLRNGAVRKGLIGVLDMELYDYGPGSGSLIRATEGTVPERIVPRARIRENAPLDVPHILVLIDDADKRIIEPFHERVDRLPKVYDFELMQGGGHIRGYRLSDADYRQVAAGLARLADPREFASRYGVEDRPPLLFAMGDGNHSLGAAKNCYEKLKERLGRTALSHPARYALVELENLHDEALVFEPIHRVVFETDETDLLAAWKTWAARTSGPFTAQTIVFVTSAGERTFRLEHPACNLAVGSVQAFWTPTWPITRAGSTTSTASAQPAIWSARERSPFCWTAFPKTNCSEPSFWKEPCRARRSPWAKRTRSAITWNAAG